MAREQQFAGEKGLAMIDKLCKSSPAPSAEAQKEALAEFKRKKQKEMGVEGIVEALEGLQAA